MCIRDSCWSGSTTGLYWDGSPVASGRFSVFFRFAPPAAFTSTQHDGCRGFTDLTEAECLAYRDSHSSPTCVGDDCYAWSSNGGFPVSVSYLPYGCQFFYYPVCRALL